MPTSRHKPQAQTTQANITQAKRLAWRTGFFALFVLAPVFDILRLDLTLGHFILFGHNWTLGIDAFSSGQTSPLQAGFDIFWRGFLPLILIIGTGFYVSWRWGRLYCGWLCPHFSVVESINALMRRASGKPSLWEKKSLPEKRPDGAVIRTNKLWWIPTVVAVIGFAFLWAVAFLTYLLPPIEIYSNLWNLSLTDNQSRFILVATLLLSIEFAFARHLFCRFGCAVGLFQSLIWMANKKAMVVGFNRDRAHACDDCDMACEHACPMRLKPRTIKRRMFTCTQCAQCVQACEHTRVPHKDDGVLKWVDNSCALPVSDMDFGRRPKIDKRCFESDGDT